MAAALALALVLLAGQAPASPETVGWIDRLERALAGLSGRVLALPPGAFGDRPREPVHAVLHAPTSSVWILAGPEPGAEVVRSGTVHRGGTVDGGWVTVTWDDGGLYTLTAPVDVPAAGGVHPLARLHDRLVSAPLARPVGGLPAGSRFHAAGTVGLPRGGSGTATLWASLGDHIVVTHPDGTAVTLHWSGIAEALPAEGGE